MEGAANFEELNEATLVPIADIPCIIRENSGEPLAVDTNPRV